MGAGFNGQLMCLVTPSWIVVRRVVIDENDVDCSTGRKCVCRRETYHFRVPPVAFP